MRTFITFTSIGHVLNTAATVLANEIREGRSIEYDFGRCRITTDKKGNPILKYRVWGILPYGGIMKGNPHYEVEDQIKGLMAHGVNLNNGGLREFFRRSF